MREERLGLSGYGAERVLMLPPFFYKGVSDEGLFRHYSEVIERVGDARLKVYLYHIPQIAQVPLNVPLIERLITAYPGTIAGIKDSSGDWNNTQMLIETFAEHGLRVYAGSERFLMPALRLGGAGCISATANVHPGPMAELASDPNTANADDRQMRLTEIREVFESVPMIPALKAATAHFSGHADYARVRPPLVELSDAQHRTLMDRIEATGFAMPGRRSA
ncbi:dihydrodipicolinate synthase family protein [Salinisphaera sp. SWV1]|uniref:dihydrodipicolinate synthase family protein n=1 Tax=Salinisphaera sp. SWV1 TaxID=3454139 RepID=UPI003F845A44